VLRTTNTTRIHEVLAHWQSSAKSEVI